MLHASCAGKPYADAAGTWTTEWNGIKVGVVGLVEEEWLDTLASINKDEVGSLMPPVPLCALRPCNETACRWHRATRRFHPLLLVLPTAHHRCSTRTSWQWGASWQRS